MNVSSEKFRALLIEDEKCQVLEQTKQLQEQQNNIHRKKALQVLLQMYGVIPKDASDIDEYKQFEEKFKPILMEHGLITRNKNSNEEQEEEDDMQKDGHWKRSLPISILSMPICTPALTTVVPLNSLPKSQRSNYISKIPSSSSSNCDGDDNETLVEVFISSLSHQSTEGQNQNRPLAGNLTSKLVEYTRGQVGTRRPFKPGGLTDDDNHNDDNNNKQQQKEINPDHKNWDEHPLYSPVERKNAIDVIEKGSIEAWKDGTLITCPPGVNFNVGLGPEDILNPKDLVGIGEKGCNVMRKTEKQNNELNVQIKKNDNNQSNVVIDAPPMLMSIPTRAISTSKMWDKSYFEEDSLFGNDSSSEEESDDDENEDENSYHDEETGEDSTSIIDSKSTNNDEKIINGEEYNLENEEDIDMFLSELEATRTRTEVDKITYGNQKKSIKFMNQILSVKKAKERKCWAVTTSLNLQDFYTAVPNPAITYPFELDGFQKQAVARLERGECIFVAAHTSAGKTVCAEYAIALARKHCTRAIYTSPIKALSNQKYRDFRDKFGDDVGLITGDLQINADSSCLIMTTEILRSMLYRGADLIRDIEWVIFDEVHYINDTERGVVWEEVIIMLPDYVNMIFLSATTPNTIDFSDWIGRTKRKPVHVIRTNYRPVPLSHFLWAGSKLHKILEGNGSFLNKGYMEASKALVPQSERDKKQQNAKKKGPMGGSKQTVTPSYRSTGSSQSAWQQSGNRQNWTSLVKFLDREGLTPTVIFSFSKKKCEEIANMLSTLDLNTASERNAAHSFTIQTMARLSPRDSSLPQVVATCEMVKRGIGVHHGGLLPILKEMVEILFSRNLIKILFATETFAMGVNMPARAVVFNSIRKHDGSRFRVLEPGEYTQMAGRAGRRGKDKVGTVIMCCFGDEPPPQLILQKMLTGSSTKLQSQFRLTYNMIMNLLRVEDMTVEGMIKRSFSEFATQRALTSNEYPKLLKRGLNALNKLDKHYEEKKELILGDTIDISDYFFLSSSLLSLNQQALLYLLGCAGASCGGALVAGRIIYCTAPRKKGFVKAPALILKPPEISSNSNDTSSPHLICMVLYPKNYVNSTELNDTRETGSLDYVGESMNRHYVIKRIELDEILYVTSLKYKIDASKLYSDKSGNSMFISFGVAKPKVRTVDDFGIFAGIKPRAQLGKIDRHDDKDQLVDTAVKYLIQCEKEEFDVQAIDYSECCKGARQGDEAFQFNDMTKRILENVQKLKSFQSHYSQNLFSCYVMIERKETLRRDIKTLQHLLSNESLQLFPDFLQRKSVLKTLNYIDENDTVCVKGRVACEVNTCEEIIVTEMIFEGILNKLEPAEIVAALSALIFQEKTSASELDSELPESLRIACEKMTAIAINLGQLQNDHGIPIVAKDYCDNSLKFGLVHVVYEWANGVPFSNITELTDVQEGSIVRTIVRLDELCREVRNCSRIVGNPILYRKMEEASAAIKRDIVFASSLYVT